MKMAMGLRQRGFIFPSAVINPQCKSGLQALSCTQPSSTVWKSCVFQKKKFLYVVKTGRRLGPVALTVEAQHKVTFHAGETAVTVPFSKEAAIRFSNAINSLLQTFQKKAAAAKPQRWESLEFQHSSEDGLNVEFFCNPNAYANAFQAKVLMTISDEKIKVISEGLLSAIKSDVDQFVEMSV